jgi:hypothetical protein
MTDGTRRSLTQGEQFVLAQIQDIYGPQNEESDVFFSDPDEAVIFVKDRTGASVGVVVLTTWRRCMKTEQSLLLMSCDAIGLGLAPNNRWRGP